MTNIQSKPVPAPTASDLAFEEFRKVFPVTNNCRVDDEGLYMNYRLPHLRSAFTNLQRAQQIISQQKLPLKATVNSRQTNHILHIQYAGR